MPLMEIRISRSSRKCCASSQDFSHEDEIVSLVRQVDGTLVREDYARTSWDQRLAGEAYSVWSTKYVDPDAAQQEPEENYSPLRQLFYEAAASEERTELATAFLAAQLLRRQKVFRQVRESVEDDERGRLVLYVDRIGNRLVEVRDPDFSYAELETARMCLMERLQELESEATEAPAPEVEIAPEEKASFAEHEQHPQGVTEVAIHE